MAESKSKQRIGHGSFSAEEVEVITRKFFEMSLGVGAMVSTDYNDINKKRGVAWEVSREINMGLNEVAYSCIQLGSLPIDIKARNIGVTGVGVIASVYALDPSDINLSGLQSVKIYNKHGNSTRDPEMKIYTIPDTVFNNGAIPLETWLQTRKIGADIHGRTNSQNQAKGYLGRPFNSDRVFDPNISDKVVVFSIKSYDSQFVDAYLDIYEGPLDFTLET